MYRVLSFEFNTKPYTKSGLNKCRSTNPKLITRKEEEEEENKTEKKNVWWMHLSYFSSSAVLLVIKSAQSEPTLVRSNQQVLW